MHADVAEGGSAENGVGDGMGENVGIGVAFEADFRRDGYTAENERALAYEPVIVPAKPGAILAQALP